jgi:hypothetical protein
LIKQDKTILKYPWKNTQVSNIYAKGDPKLGLFHAVFFFRKNQDLNILQGKIT